MTPRGRRAAGAGILAALLAGAAVCHDRAQARREPGDEAREALARVLTPGEMAAATLLGGFRSIAVDILWVRLLQGLEEQRFEDLPPLYAALEALLARSTGLAIALADQQAFDIPQLLRHRPDERWAWIRRGLETLERGLARHPGSPELLREAEFVYFLRFDPATSPGDRARFLGERARPGDLVPFGRDPLARARAAGEAAQAVPGHPFDVDYLLWRILRSSASLAERGEPPAPGALSPQEILDRTARLIDHVERAHPIDMIRERFLPEWRAELEERRKVLEAGGR